MPDLEALLNAASAAPGAAEKDALVADALAIISASRSGRATDVALNAPRASENSPSAPPLPGAETSAPFTPPQGWVGLVSYRCTGCGSTQLGHAGHGGQVSVCCGAGTYELLEEVSA